MPVVQQPTPPSFPPGSGVLALAGYLDLWACPPRVILPPLPWPTAGGTGGGPTPPPPPPPPRPDVLAILRAWAEPPPVGWLPHAIPDRGLPGPARPGLVAAVPVRAVPFEAIPPRVVAFPGIPSPGTPEPLAIGPPGFPRAALGLLDPIPPRVVPFPGLPSPGTPAPDPTGPPGFPASSIGVAPEFGPWMGAGLDPRVLAGYAPRVVAFPGLPSPGTPGSTGPGLAVPIGAFAHSIPWYAGDPLGVAPPGWGPFQLGLPRSRGTGGDSGGGSIGTAPSGGGTFAIGSLGCCCNTPTDYCKATVCVTGCPSGAALVGATVTVLDPSSGYTFSCQSAPDGRGNACCGLTLPRAGTYNLTVSAPGYQTYSASRPLGCGQKITVPLAMSWSPSTVTISVGGCCNTALPGADVKITGPDGDEYECTTPPTGQCNFTLAKAGTYTYTVTKDRFADAKGTFWVPDCSTQNLNIGVQMVPAPGYYCGPVDEHDEPRPDPLPATLHLTDSVYGACTLTYGTSEPGAGGQPSWSGTIEGANFPGACGCPPSTFSIRYSIRPCGLAIVPIGGGNNGGAYVNCHGQGAVQHHCPADPGSCDDCAGGEDFSLSGCCDVVNTGGCPSSEAGGIPLSGIVVAPGVPFDLTATIDPAPPACDQKGYGGIAWFAGGTLSVTE